MMKTYVLTISEHFPKTHPRAGEPTEFIQKIKDGRKIHTIRANYGWWEKPIKEIQAGNAVLSIITWEGKPYRSKQIEQLVLDKDSGIGVQKIVLKELLAFPTKICNFDILSTNDGLNYKDFIDWFKNYGLTQPMAIIHFTKFRY